jgi:hypothetical protein
VIEVVSIFLGAMPDHAGTAKRMLRRLLRELPLDYHLDAFQPPAANAFVYVPTHSPASSRHLRE